MKRRTPPEAKALLEGQRHAVSQDTPMLRMIASTLREKLDILSRGRFSNGNERTRALNEITQLHALAHAAVNLSKTTELDEPQRCSEDICALERHICKASFLMYVSQLSAKPKDKILHKQLSNLILQAYTKHGLNRVDLITLLNRTELQQLSTAEIETEKHKVIDPKP